MAIPLLKDPMRQKPLLIGALLLVILGALGVFYFATTTFISNAFSQLETREITQNSARAVDALTNRIDQLVFKATDWSSWDDTYTYVENQNYAFAKSNLQN